MSKNIITASSINSVLTMSIVGQIYDGQVAPQVKMFVDQSLVNGDTSAEIYINSPGGSVFEAQEIVNELKRLPEVSLCVGSLAASAATYIMCYFPTECYETSQFMIHKPSSFLSGNEDQMKAEIKAIENLTKTYRTAYAKKMGITENALEALWINDYWMTSQEAFDCGLVQEIITEGLEADEQTIMMMVACGCPTIPNIKTKKEDMSLVLLTAAFLMSAQSTEAEILVKVQALQESTKNAETETANWKQKFEALQTAEAESLVTKAIALGLIPEALKAVTIGTFTADAFVDQKAAFEKLISDKEAEELKNGRHVAVATALGKKPTGLPAGDERECYDYLQKNNPQALRDLHEKDPEKYNALADAYAKGKRYVKA